MSSFDLPSEDIKIKVLKLSNSNSCGSQNSNKKLQRWPLPCVQGVNSFLALMDKNARQETG